MIDRIALVAKIIYPYGMAVMIGIAILGFFIRYKFNQPPLGLAPTFFFVSQIFAFVGFFSYFTFQVRLGFDSFGTNVITMMIFLTPMAISSLFVSVRNPDVWDRLVVFCSIQFLAPLLAAAALKASSFVVRLLRTLF